MKQGSELILCDDAAISNKYRQELESRVEVLFNLKIYYVSQTFKNLSNPEKKCRRLKNG